MIRILIADDHPVVRSGLRQILEEYPDMKIVAEHDNGASVLRWTHENDCDVVLLDIAMPGKSGIDVLKKLHEEKPRLPVLVISIYPEDQYAVRLIKAGAAGYLPKESAPEVVVDAVRHVAIGKKYISKTVAELLANEFGAPEEKLAHERLSDREYQIFQLLTSAKTATEIAALLGLSVKTVSTYRGRILEKMSLRNNAELMRYAVDHHLME